MKTNTELEAVLNMVLARLKSDPRSEAEWILISHHLRTALKYAEKTRQMYVALDDRES